MYIKWQYKWFGNKFLFFFFNSPSPLTFWITCALYLVLYYGLQTQGRILPLRLYRTAYKHYLTNSLELSPAGEAGSRSATQEFPHILWNPKVYYRDHRSPPLLPIRSQINLVHTISFSLRSNLILFSHLRRGLPPTYFKHSSSPQACYVPCTSIWNT
jgi:hypothetical protein